MKRSRGLTLLELMVGVAIAGVLLIAVAGLVIRFLSTGGGENQAEATDQATRWATQMGLKDTSVSCATAVRGKGAMVPCTVAVPTKGGLPAIYGLECGAFITLNGQNGCRVTSAPAVTPQ